LWLPALVALAVVPGAWADQGAVQVASGAPTVWADSVRLIEAGQFGKAAAQAEELEGLGPEGEQVARWLRDLLDMQAQRDEMTQADHDKYVAWAIEQHAKGNIMNALWCAVRALENTEDQDAFRKESWLDELRQDALARAASQREEGKWLDAHSVYYQLAAIWERDPQLKKLKRECLTHARLEVSYKPDSKWREYLAGIEWRMATDALFKIRNYYVTKPDFRELAIAGLEQLVMLAESPALREVFPSLNNKHDRNQFIDRINEHIRQVRRAKEVPQGDVSDRFRRALDINMVTVELPESLLVSEFMSAAMDTLDDFSTVIWPVEFKEFDKHTKGKFIGVGISIARVEGEITVMTPLEDSPAYYAGILADDVIIKVNGEDIKNLSLTQAVEVITGPIGTTVTLTIRRNVDGVDQEIDFHLKRSEIVIQSVKGFQRDPENPQRWDFMLDAEMGIGYIRVGQFADNTVAHLYRTVEELRDRAGLKTLILDLRFNPGGLLTSAVQMSELFLDKGERIVSTKGERMREWPIDAERRGPFFDLPLVVLINGQSASASEIVSGALQDHGRATIIGERTFGKFSVQNLMQLSGTDAHLKLTTAAYYLPSGRSLHHDDDATEWGVDPDIDVPLVTKELLKVLALRRRADVLVKPGMERPEPAPDSDKPPAEEAGEAEKSDKPEEDSERQDGEDEEHEEEPLPPDPNERPEIDPQLETALFVARVRLLGESSPQIVLQGPAKSEVGVE
jgi:carboxyl-terminal processing protease